MWSGYDSRPDGLSVDGCVVTPWNVLALLPLLPLGWIGALSFGGLH